MKIKTIYTDFDGTLSDEQKNVHVSPQLVKELQKVLEIVVVTGRNIDDALPIFNSYQIDFLLCDWGRVRVARAKEALLFDYNPGTGCPLPLWETGPAGAIEKSGIIAEINRYTDSKLQIDTRRFDSHASRISLVGQADYMLVNRFLDKAKIGLELMKKRRCNSTQPKWHLGAKGVTKRQAISWDMQIRGISPLESISIGNEPSDMDMSLSTGLYFDCSALSNINNGLQKLQEGNDSNTGPDAWTKLAKALLEGISAA